MNKPQVWQPATSPPGARDEANLLQEYLRSLQQTSLPAIALVLLAVSAVIFLWLHTDNSHIFRWDLCGLLVCLVALGAWLLRDRYPLGTWFVAAGLSLSPLLALAATRAVSVRCLGSGVMREELRAQYQNPYPVETAIYRLERDELAAEVTRTLFHCARPYMESFTIYGEDACYEWQMEDRRYPHLQEVPPPPGGTPLRALRPLPYPLSARATIPPQLWPAAGDMQRTPSLPA